jgi:hypothetical protein
VIAWLPTASREEKRRIAVVLAQDVRAMRKVLMPAPPAKATDQQVFARAMGLLAPPLDDAPTTH